VEYLFCVVKFHWRARTKESERGMKRKQYVICIYRIRRPKFWTRGCAPVR